MNRGTTIVTVLLGVLMVVPGAWAQVLPGNDVPPVPDRTGVPDLTVGGPTMSEAYGTDGSTVAMVAPHAFHPYKDGLGYVSWTGGFVGPMTGTPYRFFDAEIHLPTGALLGYFWAAIYDDSDTAGVSVWLYEGTCPMNQECTETTIAEAATAAADTPGYTVVGDFSLAGTTWRNFDSSGSPLVAVTHRLRVSFGDDTSSVRLGPVWLWYRRQVSPAPLTATFGDVSTEHWAFQFVEALAASGITSGCGGGNYCPDNPITRAEMAVFLAAGLGLHYPDI